MENGVMFQSFEWEMESTGEFYNELAALAPDLAQRGIDAVWLPPVYKATSVWDVGYGVYDLFDLGEFDQKGDVRTKYGTKDQLLACIQALKNENIAVYMDVVLNHKAGADYSEVFKATPVNQENRLEEVGDTRDIEAWTGFNFPGRQGKYSEFEWFHQHFNGVDFDQRSGETGIFRVEGENKGWAYGVSGEKGNFDYLMFADIDHNHPDVRNELFAWADWFIAETGCDGFRMDAIKHIDDHFLDDFSGHIKDKYGPEFYLFGEYWSPRLDNASEYLYEVRYNMDIFDVGLHFHLEQASSNEHYDLRKIFDNTVVKAYPGNAVTFVDNHDSQPGQSLESWVGRHFKERAYALILLRKDGYPCIFSGDYYGIHGGPVPQENLQYDINRLLEVRHNFAYGEQTDFFQQEQAIAWTRHGDENHPGLLAVVMSMKEETSLHLSFGPDHAGREFHDYLNRYQHTITLDENGDADFPVQGASLSCWITGLDEEHQDDLISLKSIEERSAEEHLTAGE